MCVYICVCDLSEINGSLRVYEKLVRNSHLGSTKPTTYVMYFAYDICLKQMLCCELHS